MVSRKKCCYRFTQQTHAWSVALKIVSIVKPVIAENFWLHYAVVISRLVLITQKLQRSSNHGFRHCTVLSTRYFWPDPSSTVVFLRASMVIMPFSDAHQDLEGVRLIYVSQICLSFRLIYKSLPLKDVTAQSFMCCYMVLHSSECVTAE